MTLSEEKLQRLIQIKAELEALKAQTLIVNKKYTDDLDAMNWELEQRMGEAGDSITDEERQILYDRFCFRLINAMRARFAALKALDARFQQCAKILREIDN